MITEKSHTAQDIIEKISSGSAKVAYMDDAVLTKALLNLENKGIPNQKHEDYKYCNIDAILRKEFKSPEQKFLSAKNADHYKLKEACNLVFVNGNFAPELSDKKLPEGISIIPFDQFSNTNKGIVATLADVESDAFIALNTVFSANGIRIVVDKVVDQALQLIYLNTCSGEAIVNPRNAVELEKDASLILIERQITEEGKVFSNWLSEKKLSAHSNLTSYLIQEQGDASFALNTTQVEVDEMAVYDNTTITLSGKVVRNNHNVVLKGVNAQAHLYGLMLADDHQLVDNHTLMDHQVPDCESNELYKGVANGKSTGVFNGKIFVRKDAQKTNAYQSSKNILLSDDATINTKPQLEIYANDVKCSHGTSTGKIDPSALFYLKARGIGAESARKILLASFAGEISDKIRIGELKLHIENQINRKL